MHRALRARWRAIGVAVVIVGFGAALSACTTTANPVPGGTIVAVGAESQYADVSSQIGGKYVTTTAILSNPNTDPHSFESSPGVARSVSAAGLIVENGLGYDDFMAKIEAAAPDPSRRVITVQRLLGLPDSTPNPHLWYKPTTMPIVARAIAKDLSLLDPSHASYFSANAGRFLLSLTRWDQALASLRATVAGAPVATTEPVSDYMLEAAGLDNLTPATFQSDVMNGTDPSPQDISVVTDLLVHHRVKVFVYNQQVTDSLTGSLLPLARQHHIPWLL